GIGAFTPDSFPVFDTFRENAYVIADSNHGYKMIGVGALVAKELLGEPQALLEPFRFSRYRTGRLHPVSNSPFPWSSVADRRELGGGGGGGRARQHHPGRPGRARGGGRGPGAGPPAAGERGVRRRGAAGPAGQAADPVRQQGVDRWRRAWRAHLGRRAGG